MTSLIGFMCLPINSHQDITKHLYRKLLLKLHSMRKAYRDFYISLWVYHAYFGAAVAQWIALAAHGQWVVGSNPIRVIGGVRKGIRPQLLLCSKGKSVPSQDPLRKKFPIPGFSQGTETLNRDEFLMLYVCREYMHVHPGTVWIQIYPFLYMYIWYMGIYLYTSMGMFVYLHKYV